MQEENVPHKGFLDKMTDGVIRRYSRRGLLGDLGKKGLILASAMGLSTVGLGVDTPLAQAATGVTHASVVTVSSIPSGLTFEPDASGCLKVPPPCNGGCVSCPGHTSSCTTGGARCSFSVSGSCLPTPVRAHGSFDCQGHFHCTTLQC